MTRQRVGRDGAKAVLLMAAGLAAASLSFTGCSGSSGTPTAPSTSACWNAMLAQYRHDAATGATGTEPPECRGVADSVLQSYALQLLAGKTEAPTP